MDIYLLDITQMPENAVPEYAPLLDPARREKISRCKRAADQKRSLGAGMLLCHAWRAGFAKSPLPQVRTDKNGRPYFAGCDIPFSLSHSGKYAACVLGEPGMAAVGLDIQEPRRILPDVVRRFFSEGERLQVQGGENACLVWSRKESLAKYCGTGLRGELSRLDSAAYADKWPEFIRSFWTQDGYAVSVCAERKENAAGNHNREGGADRLLTADWQKVSQSLLSMEKLHGISKC